MEKNFSHSSEKFTKILDNLFSLLKEINHIIIINTNEIFLKDVLENLKNDTIINDTITILKLVNFDLSRIAYSDSFFNIGNCENGNLNFSNNKFYLLSKNLEKIMNEIHLISNNYCDKVIDIIEEEKQKKKNENKIKKTKTEREKPAKIKMKKLYEVDILSRYMIDIFNKNNIKNIIEMGCGKSYLTNNILIQEDMVYFGIDKKDHLIENSDLRTKKNIFLINEIVDYKNFNNIYEEQIKENLSNYTDNNNDKKNIMLFGLHSCGNLSSDSIKIFVKNDVLTQLVIVGCCLNLLVEFVSEEVKNSKFFKRYYNSIGYDNRGSFLEITLDYEWDFRKIGYPICEYIRKEHKDIFLGRPLRNIAMQNIPKEADYLIDSKRNLKYKNLLYRTMLQTYFEIHFNELKYIYGYGKLHLNLDDSFSLYIKNCLTRIQTMIETNDLKVNGIDCKHLKIKAHLLMSKIKDIPEEKALNAEAIENKNIDENFMDLEKFFEFYLQYENILWAFYTIRIKFAKIIEFIIAFDRILFLKENNVENVELVKIFDDKKSARNILIYASKI